MALRRPHSQAGRAPTECLQPESWVLTTDASAPGGHDSHLFLSLVDFLMPAVIC